MLERVLKSVSLTERAISVTVIPCDRSLHKIYGEQRKHRFLIYDASI
jgi:hypothetical protein